MAKENLMYIWMQMISLGVNGIGFFKKSAKKECERFLLRLGFDGGNIESAKEEELYEMACKFIETSLDSPSYASSILGLKRATKDEAKVRMCSDIKRGAVDYLLTFDKSKESEKLLSIFKRAYIEQVKEGDKVWEACFSNPSF